MRGNRKRESRKVRERWDALYYIERNELFHYGNCFDIKRYGFWESDCFC